MEEDIKIIEEYLDKQDRKFVSEYRLMILQSIENLIAENKKLQEELEDWKFTKNYVEDNYIDKSKVRELREIDNVDLLQFKIKELLQEGDK